MYVLVDLQADGSMASSVTEAGVLTELEMRISASVSGGLGEHIAAQWAGHIENEHAWLAIDLLRLRAAVDDPAWPARFSEMIAFAASKGWVSADRRLVRVHIVAAPEGGSRGE